MREKLFRFVLPVDSKKMEPRDAVEVLQTLALSVSPVALTVQINHISPPELHSIGGLLPCGPIINTDSIEIVSEPEISKVAQRITRLDIPASEAIWNLLNYDYTIDQIARLMSVGLLGHFEIISRAMIELADSRRNDESRIYMSSLFGDSFTVLSIPGEPRVDYLRMEKKSNGLTCASSLEDLHCPSTDITTASLADHARFSAYTTMAADKSASHLVIFHLSRNARSNSLGPWISRAGVKDALLSTPVPMKDKGNALAVLTSVLRPELGRWASDIPLLEILGLEETTHPLVHTSV
jgi:hypothetical protein